MHRCECDHYSHMETVFSTPAGNQAHMYGALFSTENMTYVEKPGPRLHVCLGCAEDCQAYWYAKQQMLNEMGH